MNENALAVLEGPSLGDIPILVLSSDSGKQWQEVQTKLASWSENSEQVTLQGAKHYLYWSSYDSVIEHIDRFINEKLKHR